MTLDAQDLKKGKKFIVGTWQAESIVNGFSDDLAEIPVSEFKSQDGKDFSVISFIFLEDNTMKMENTSDGTSEDGTWEQTSYSEFRFTCGAAASLTGVTADAPALQLMMKNDRLVLGIGIIAIILKKTAEGTVTEEPDIGDIQPSEADLAMNDIVGRYGVVKSMAMVGNKFGLFSKDEVLASLNEKKEAGEVDEHEIRESMAMFDTVIEFTDDHKVITWMKLPEGVSQEEIDKAIEAGEIKEVRDGCFTVDEKDWKAVGGKYYIDTKEQRELFGEVQSSWDELVIDEDGLMDFSSGMMKLGKLLKSFWGL